MADKKAAKNSKALGKKDMKKTKGGIIAVTNTLPAVQHDISFRPGTNNLQPGQINGCDGSV